MLSGEVTVPYTGIGGMNINGGIMTMADISGSTDPNASNPMTLNIRWKLPGGITGISWGYAVYSKAMGGSITTDQNVTDWLLGKVSNGRITPTKTFESEEDIYANVYEVNEQLKSLFYEYVDAIWQSENDDDIQLFLTSFGPKTGCTSWGK